MVTEVVVKESLSNEMITAGKTLTEMLDKSHFSVNSSLWFFISDANEWRFIIATSEIKKIGLKKSYEKVRSIIHECFDEDFSIALKNISLVEPSDTLISLLKRMIKTDSKKVSAIRFSRNMINGTLIDDSYIYRLT
jgi:hypothetical protein